MGWTTQTSMRPHVAKALLKQVGGPALKLNPMWVWTVRYRENPDLFVAVGVSVRDACDVWRKHWSQS